MVDQTIQHDRMYLAQIRTWLGRPLWTMQPADADRFFGEALRTAAPNSKRSKACSLAVYFRYLELRHKARCTTAPGTSWSAPWTS